MRAALIAEGVAPDAITIVEEENKALDTALAQARPDDLVLFFCEAITRGWKQIVHFTPKFTRLGPSPYQSAWRHPTSMFPMASFSPRMIAECCSFRRMPERHDRETWHIPLGSSSGAAIGPGPPSDATPELAIIGGRLEDDNAAIYDEMHRLSGGRIVVFATASSVPTRSALRPSACFGPTVSMRSWPGFTAPGRSGPRRTKAIADLVADYGSVYFTGGDQALITGALAPYGRESRVQQF